MKNIAFILFSAALLLSCTQRPDVVTATSPTDDHSEFVILTDVVPDAIPIAGLTDDLAVLLYVLKKVWTDIDPEIQQKAKERLAKWFDEDEITEINDLFKEE